MFITKKIIELHEETVKAIQRIEKENKDLKDMILSLAKELGYTWESEEKKEKKKQYMTIVYSDRTYQQYVGDEKAVLKWGWKKIPVDRLLPEKNKK